MRLMFLGDKILGGTSAYSKIGDETCKRLAKLGHKVAHIPMGFANRMGTQLTQEGVQIYPSGANAFGEDVAIEDYLNFKADLLITIKEPWCVPPETLIETPMGQFTIKKFIEKGLWRFIPVKGSQGFTKVLDTQTIACKNKLVEIEISSGKKVRVTKDNLIYVPGKGWMLPTKIKIGDGVIITIGDYQFGEKIHAHGIRNDSPIISPENINREHSENSWASKKIDCKQSLGTWPEENLPLFQRQMDRKGRRTFEESIPYLIQERDSKDLDKPNLVKHNPPITPIRSEAFRNRKLSRQAGENNESDVRNIGNRQGLPSRNNRWRRLHRNIEISSSKSEERTLCNLLLPNKHFKEIDGLAGNHILQQNGNSSEFGSKGKQFGKNALLQDHNWHQEMLCFAEGDNAIPYHQERESGISDQIRTSETFETSQVCLWARGTDHIQRDYGLAEKVTCIKEVSYNGLVYDLTTESGDFFANGILIHNCFNHIPFQPINFVPMCIIDHSPVSTEITSKLTTAFKVIAVSRFGQMELKRAEIESYYIPHGVNTSIYKPYPEKKKEYRKLWYLDPDAYTIGIVAMNRSRKLISRMLRGYKRFREINPNVKSQLLLWTDIMPMDMPEDPLMGVADVGVNLLPEILQLGLNEHVIWPHRDLIRHGLPEWSGEDGKWDMVKLYNCFDVLLHCTGGEGFALPLIEAQSCGVPVITTDYAAAPEQVGAGLTVRADDYVILNTPGTRYYLANIDGMAEALTKIYNADREKLARKARAFSERYSWDKIIDVYWNPFLEKCEGELRPLITKEGIKTWS